MRQRTIPVKVPAARASGDSSGDFVYEIALEMRRIANTVAVAVRDDLGGVASYVNQQVRLGS